MSDVMVRRAGRKAWTVEDPPQHIRQLVNWWVHERREGESQAHFAQAAGVSLQSVRNWMTDPRVREMVGAALEQSNASMPKVQMVLDMLYRRATQDDDVKAARTYLEAVGRMAPKQTEVNVTITDARGLSDDQLRAELQRAVALLEQRSLPEPVEEAEVISDTGG